MMSAVGQRVLEGVDLVAVHRRLQRADRVDLGDDDAGALAAQRLGAALADVAVAADDRDLAADEYVGRAVDAVDQRVAAAVLVVELRLGDRVVDVDRREEQRAVAHHLVETVHAGGGLLGDALDRVGDRRPVVGALRELGLEHLEDDPLLVAGGGGRVGRLAGLLGLHAEVQQQGGVATVVEDHVGLLVGGPVEDLLGAPPVLLQGLALPGEDRHALRVLGGALGPDDDRGGRVVLGGEDVAGGPAHLGAERDQGLDEHGGLDGHVQRAGDPGAREGLVGAVALPHRHQAGHLVLGEGDLGAAVVGEAQVLDLEVHASVPFQRGLSWRRAPVPSGFWCASV